MSLRRNVGRLELRVSRKVMHAGLGCPEAVSTCQALQSARAVCEGHSRDQLSGRAARKGFGVHLCSNRSCPQIPLRSASVAYLASP